MKDMCSQCNKKKDYNKILTAREAEIETLKKQYDIVLDGKNSLSVISGSPGIGKTFLVKHVVNHLLSNKAIYVYGKFRQHDKKPFIAISEIVEQMVKYILTLPYEQLDNIKDEFEKTLGIDVQIIISICPYSTKIFDQNKNINIDDYEKLKYRVKKALYQFLVIASRNLFPMIICIDDLQWGDKPSLEMIELICKDSDFLNLMLILTYRDNDEKYINNLENLTKILHEKNDHVHIQLRELTYINIKEYIQLIFGTNFENIDYLGRLIFGLTLGNAFYMKEVIDIFIKEKIIVYSIQDNHWKVNINKINGISLSSDIEHIIMNKVNKLCIQDKSLLELISCLDGIVDYKILKSIEDKDNEIMRNQLERLCESGFLVKTMGENKAENIITYGFVHDIILDIIYKNIEANRKLSIHYDIAKKLLEYFDEIADNTNRMFIASQLLRCDYNILKNENTNRWVNELYFAGIKARQTTAIEEATKIFKLCIILLPFCKSEGKNDLEMQINLNLGECQFICRKYEEAKKIFDYLIDKYNSIENIITIKRKYMNLCSYNGDCEKNIKLGIEVLNHLDYKFNFEDVQNDLEKGKLILTHNKIDNLINAPLITDNRILIILETLTNMIPSANCINDKIFNDILIKIGFLSIEYGNSRYSPIGYAALSYISYNIWRDYDKAKKFEDITIELLDKTDNLTISSYVNSFIGTFVDHWSNHMNKSIKLLEKSIEEGIKAGDFLFCGYSIVSIIYAKYIMGIPFKEISNHIELRIKQMQTTGDNTITFIDDIFNRHITYLEKGLLLKDNDKLKELMETLDYSKNVVYYVFLLQRLYLEGKIDKAYEVVEKIKDNIDFLKGHIIYLDLLFYCTIVRIDMHEKLEENYREENIELIQENINVIKSWIEVYKENHYSRYLLLKAEYAVIFEKGTNSEKLFNEAISFAEEKEQLQLEALGNLLAARNTTNNKKLSRFYAKEAAIIYKKWGASYISSLIEKEYELNRFKIKDNNHIDNTISQENTRYIETNQDIIYQLNKIENMDEKQGFIYMLDYLAQNNQVDYSAILFEKSNEMFIQYEKKNNDKAISLNKPKNIRNVRYISRKIIRYVSRTEEEIILNKKPEWGIFTKDSYIMEKDEISIICIPIKYLDVLVGLIYLEKKCENCFNKNTSIFIKSVIPTLISKRKTIKDINLHNLLSNQNTSSPLTEREEEVLKLVAEGLSNLAISKKLFISQGTVKNHLSSIYSKLEVDSRIKAVIKAKELNILKI